jgi:hypothetical protein
MSVLLDANGKSVGWNIINNLNAMLNEMDEGNDEHSIGHAEVVVGEPLELRFPDIKVLCGVDMAHVANVAAKYGFESTLNGYNGVVAIHLWAHDTTKNDTATETQNAHT